MCQIVQNTAFRFVQFVPQFGVAVRFPRRRGKNARRALVLSGRLCYVVFE